MATVHRFFVINSLPEALTSLAYYYAISPLKAKNKRVDEIDGLIQKLFENNASGKLSDERFETLTATYENKQSELKSKIPELENKIDNSVRQFNDVQTFIEKVKRITRVKKLTPELLNEFIERIDVHAVIKINGKRYQVIDIHYNSVGLIKRLPP